MDSYEDTINDLICRLNDADGGSTCRLCGGFDDYLYINSHAAYYSLKGHSAYLCNTRLFTSRYGELMIEFLERELRDIQKMHEPAPDGSSSRPFTKLHLFKARLNQNIKTAKNCREYFILFQAKKARMGRGSRCSPGLEKEINRITRLTLEDDLGL